MRGGSAAMTGHATRHAIERLRVTVWYCSCLRCASWSGESGEEGVEEGAEVLILVRVGLQLWKRW